MPDQEIVDVIDQLAMSLKWEEDYTDEYKRRVLIDALATKWPPRPEPEEEQ